MKVAVVGSRGIELKNLSEYLPEDTTEIISGGAKGVDHAARSFALTHEIKLTEYYPDYSRYGRGAPLRRNIRIIEEAELVLAFWDSASRGTKFVIDQCQKRGIPIRIITMEK